MSRKGNALSLFFVLCAFIIMGLFMVGFSSSIVAPTSGSALNQYNNLSKVVDVAGTGTQGFILLLVAALVVAGIYLLYNSFGGKRR